MPKSPSTRHQARKNPQQSRSQQTRRDLLAGATRVLTDSGAKGFNTNRVAEVTGVSIGSLYQYYPNKGALLADLHTEQAGAVLAQLRPVLADPELSPRERLLRVVSGAFAAQATGMEHHTALLDAGVASTEMASLVELGEEVERELSSFFSKVLPQRAGEAAELAGFCVEMLFGLLGRMAQNPQRDWSRIAESTATLLADHVGL